MAIYLKILKRDPKTLKTRENKWTFVAPHWKRNLSFIIRNYFNTLEPLFPQKKKNTVLETNVPKCYQTLDIYLHNNHVCSRWCFRKKKERLKFIEEQ